MNLKRRRRGQEKVGRRSPGRGAGRRETTRRPSDRVLSSTWSVGRIRATWRPPAGVGPNGTVCGRAPRVIVRLARVPPGEQLRLPAWFDPLGIGVTCPRAVPAGAGAAAGISQPAVLAPASVDECYRFTAMAARIADRFRRDVIVLVDASLLDTVQGSASGPHPETPIDQALFGPEALLHAGQLAPPSARAAVKALLAGLRLSEAALDRFVEPGAVVGGDRGDVLLVGWGATRGPVEEAVARLRARGASVSALHRADAEAGARPASRCAGSLPADRGH